MPAYLLGLSGPKYSGKDTASQLIQQIVGEGVVEPYALAGPVKQATALIFGWPEHVLNDPKMKDQEDEYFGVSPRTAMQALGTEYPDIIGCREVWVLRAEKVRSYIDELSEPRLMVITDVRRHHEAEWLRAYGGQIWQLDRPGYDYTYEHDTEIPLPSEYIDAYLYNHKDEEYLGWQIARLLQQGFPSFAQSANWNEEEI